MRTGFLLDNRLIGEGDDESTDVSRLYVDFQSRNDGLTERSCQLDGGHRTRNDRFSQPDARSIIHPDMSRRERGTPVIITILGHTHFCARGVFH